MTSTQIDPAILELLASRICHDLISPIGAINNGIEFLEDSGAEALDDALGLLSYSANLATAKLKAFRLAYGAGGADPNLSPRETHEAFEALISAEGKINQDWDPDQLQEQLNMNPGYSKMLMATLMTAYECLPKGGTVSVQAHDPSTTQVTASGRDAALRPNMSEALNRQIDTQELDPRLAHSFAVSLLSDRYGYDIDFTENESRVIFHLAQR